MSEFIKARSDAHKLCAKLGPGWIAHVEESTGWVWHISHQSPGLNIKIWKESPRSYGACLNEMVNYSGTIAEIISQICEHVTMRLSEAKRSAESFDKLMPGRRMIS